MYSINMTHRHGLYCKDDRAKAIVLKANDTEYRYQAVRIIDSGDNAWRGPFDELQKLSKSASSDVLNPIEVLCSAVLQWCDISRFPLIIQIWLATGSPVLLEAVKLMTDKTADNGTWSDKNIRSHSNVRDDIYGLVNQLTWYSPIWLPRVYELFEGHLGYGDASAYIFEGLTAYSNHIKAHPPEDEIDPCKVNAEGVAEKEQLELSLVELNSELTTLRKRLAAIESKPPSRITASVITGITKSIADNVDEVVTCEKQLATLELSLKELYNSTAFKQCTKIVELTTDCTAKAIEVASRFTTIVTEEFAVDLLVEQENSRIYSTARDMLDKEGYRGEEGRQVRYDEIIETLKATSPIYGKLKGLTLDKAMRKSAAFKEITAIKKASDKEKEMAHNRMLRDNRDAINLDNVRNQPGYVNLKGMTTVEAKVALLGDYVMMRDR